MLSLCPCFEGKTFVFGTFRASASFLRSSLDADGVLQEEPWGRLNVHLYIGLSGVLEHSVLLLCPDAICVVRTLPRIIKSLFNRSFFPLLQKLRCWPCSAAVDVSCWSQQCSARLTEIPGCSVQARRQSSLSLRLS